MRMIALLRGVTPTGKNLRVIKTVAAAWKNYGGLTGMLTKYIPDLSITDISDTVFITVGSPVMMKFTIMGILKRGVPESKQSHFPQWPAF